MMEIKEARSTLRNDNTTTATTSGAVPTLRRHQKDGGTGRVRSGGRWGTRLGLVLWLVVGVVSLRNKTLPVVLVIIPVKLSSTA